MNTFFFRSIVCAFIYAAFSQAEAGIYLVYGATSSSTPVAVIDDPTVLDEGVLTPRVHVWISSSIIPPVSGGSVSLPLAFIPPATAYAMSGNATVPVVIMPPPTATSSPELSRLIQSGHAWSVYQSGNNASGLGLIYAPTYGASLTPSQKSASGNRARAQAFRLDYFK